MKFLGFILIHLVLIFAAKNSRRVSEGIQSADLFEKFIGEDTLVQAPNETALSDNYMYLHKTNGQSENYLNYRAVYGLRYTPTKKPIKELSSNQNPITREPEPAFSSTISNKVISSENNETENVNDEYTSSSFESETSSSSQSEMSSEGVPYHNNTSVDVSGDIELIVDESKKHIMRPNNRVEHALDFLAHRLKKLLYYSKDKNRFESKLSPHLNSLARFLNLFSLIKFENIPCLTGKKPLTQLSGTCYNEVECLSLGGIAVDRCPNGFGVCCVCESVLLIFLLSQFCVMFQGQLIKTFFSHSQRFMQFSDPTECDIL